MRVESHRAVAEDSIFRGPQMPNTLQEQIIDAPIEDQVSRDRLPATSGTEAREPLDQILHQFAHDLRSPLSIISMGIEAIRALKHDPSQLDTICDMMAQQGVESIKAQISQLCDKR